MVLAALYDIHGNLPALEAVLDELGSYPIDQIIIGGDILPGPMPLECLQRIANVSVPVRYIIGNGEEAVLNASRGLDISYFPEQAQKVIRWCADQLNTETLGEISNWSGTITVNQSHKNILFCHATPDSTTDIFTKRTSPDKFPQSIINALENIIICGHTHMQFDITRGSKRIINAGSVGMPFGAPGAYWLLIDAQVHLMKTHYNYTEAANIIQKSSYPEAFKFAEQNVLNPPSEQAMLSVFEK